MQASAVRCRLLFSADPPWVIGTYLGERAPLLPELAVVTIQPRQFMDVREATSLHRRESHVGIALAPEQ